MSYSSPAYPQHNQPPAPPPKGASFERGPPLPPPPSFGVSELPAEPAHAQAAPIEPSWIPESLKEKSTQDLYDVLKDPSMQAALLNNPATGHAAVFASEAELVPILEANVKLATSLEALGDRLASQRAATQSRLLALRALEQQYRAKITETEAALRAFSPMAQYQRLNASATEQQQLLKGIEESWIDEPGQANEREINDWVKRVKDASRVAFIRKERKARWDEGRVSGWK
ncbi:hypothetical protein AMS68_007456 [Peltaster fructicola]|uniref:VPS37 C-terminal domain-containing protein n=1 Tax=Peltaster fructicola TaxID=286661 RepID=A0A6H0Y530_9PEZI|nr:hypothetical protein AMS68_007456 [Peltaster fructicola]